MAVVTKHRKLLNTQQASEYLGGKPSKRGLEKWRKDGKGPLYHTDDGTPEGNFMGYDPDDLDRWRKGTQTHPSQSVA